MSKDEMSDDARFDAFLRGECELARRLQAIPQPSPSAELDAAILGKVRASMAPVIREAANDPVAPGPQLARSLGLRWSVPAGIAATVLVGLFARQSYETSVSAVQVSLPPQERAEAAIVHERAVPPPPPAELSMSVQETPRPEPRPQKQAPRAPAPEAVVQADAGMVAVPPPAPVMAPAPAPAPIAASSNESSIRMAPSSALSKADLADTGGLYSAAHWITRMEALVKGGEELAAAREWISFRERYPDYAAPADLEAKMKELTKSK